MNSDRDKERKDNNSSSHLIPRNDALISRGLKDIEKISALTHVKEIAASSISDLRLIKRIGAGAVMESAFSSDGSIAAVWSVKGVFVHHSLSGEKKGYLHVNEKVKSLDISPDNELVAIGLEDGEIYLWQYDEGNVTKTLETDYDWVKIVRFTPSGKHLVSVSSKRGERGSLLCLWDLDKKVSELIGTLEEPPYDIKISQDGKYLLVRPGMGMPELWSLHEGKLIRTIKEHGFDEMPSFSEDARLLGTKGSPIGKISKIETGEIIERWDLRDDVDEGPSWLSYEYNRASEREKIIASLDQYTSPIRCLEFSPDTKTLASGGDDYRIWIWDVKSGFLAKTYTLEKGFLFEELSIPNSVMSLSYSPNGKLLAVGREKGVVPIINSENGVVIRELTEHYGGVFPLDNKISVRFSPDGTLLATGGGDGKIRLWDVQSWKLLFEYDLTQAKVEEYPSGRSKETGIRDVVFSDDSKKLAVGHLNGPLKVFEVKSGTILHDIKGPTSRDVMGHSYNRIPKSYCVIFSKDNEGLFSDEGDELYIYDLKSGQQIEVKSPGPFRIFRRGHGRSSLSKDGSVWFLGNPNGHLLCVDVFKQRIIRNLGGHIKDVTCTATSSNGLFVASGGEDGTICLWGI